MKKFIPAIAVILVLALTACSKQNTAPAGVNDTQSASASPLDEGAWPVNEYTEGLPVPPGTIAWTMLDEEHGNCSVSLSGLTESDYAGYMELLKQAGFSVVEDVSEEVKGQDYVSAGMLLSNGEKGLSISYIPDSLTIYISFEKQQ